MEWLNYNLIKSMKRGGGLDGPSGPPTTGEISRILVCFWPCPLRTKKENHLKPMGGFTLWWQRDQEVPQPDKASTASSKCASSPGCWLPTVCCSVATDIWSLMVVTPHCKRTNWNFDYSSPLMNFRPGAFRYANNRPAPGSQGPPVRSVWMLNWPDPGRPLAGLRPSLDGCRPADPLPP